MRSLCITLKLIPDIHFFFSHDEPWEDPVWLMPVALVLVIFVTFMGPMFIAMFKGFDGFFRMSSLVYWIMIWIYIPFLIICAVTDCTEVSDTLSILQTLTSIFTPILCVWILIESYFCSERKYITNLGKTDTVGKTIQVRILCKKNPSELLPIIGTRTDRSSHVGYK